MSFFSKATTSNTVSSNNTGDIGASFIGTGCIFTGDIECQSSLRIEGIVKGNITGSGNIEVATNGQIEGKSITANNLIVHGKVKANIDVKGYLRIHKNAHVEGDIHAESLDIESGAHFIGYSHTGQKLSEIPFKDMALTQLNKSEITVSSDTIESGFDLK